MKPLEFPLLADENIHPQVVEHLRTAGRDVQTLYDAGLLGATDVVVLQHAHRHGRVVVTHDSDFGTLAVQAGEPYVGLVYLRPGHILPAFVIAMIDAIDRAAAHVETPFILVAERRADSVRVRLRSPGG